VIVLIFISLVGDFQGCSLLSSDSGNNVKVPASTTGREKLTQYSYKTEGREHSSIHNDNSLWELSDGDAQALEGIRYFYQKTGVNGAVLIRGYDESLASAEAMKQYGQQYFDENFLDAGTFLWIYFESRNEAENTSRGNHLYFWDDAVATVIDEEFLDIFYAYTQQYWESDLNDQELIATVFQKTADRAMAKTTTVWDVLRVLLIVVGIIVGLLVIAVGASAYMTKKRRLEAEKAEETERILRTPIEGLEKSAEDDDLLEKYK
jgi:hypothetical protein